MTSFLPAPAPRQNGAGALVGCQSVSVSLSVTAPVRSRLGSGVTAKGGHPSQPPGRNPLTGDPWTAPIASLSSSPHHPCRPACSPGFCSQQFVCPAQPVAFGTGLGVPVTRQAFPHIIKRLCFAAFLGCWGSAGYFVYTVLDTSTPQPSRFTLTGYRCLGHNTTPSLDDHDHRATKASSPIVLAPASPISYQQAQRCQGKRGDTESAKHARAHAHRHTYTEKIQELGKQCWLGS